MFFFLVFLHWRIPFAKLAKLQGSRVEWLFLLLYPSAASARCLSPLFPSLTILLIVPCHFGTSRRSLVPENLRYETAPTCQEPPLVARHPTAHQRWLHGSSPHLLEPLDARLLGNHRLCDCGVILWRVRYFFLYFSQIKPILKKNLRIFFKKEIS